MWLENRRGQSALFKPYDDFANPKGVELEAARIALALNIDRAEIEEIVLGSIEGIISYDFREEGYFYCAGWDYFPLKGVNREITLEDIIKNEELKPLKKGAVDMLFFDALCFNADRHGGNWQIKLKQGEEKTPKNCEIISLAPIFDHGYCFNTSLGDTAQFPFRRNENLTEIYEFLTLDELFSKLCLYFPAQIAELLKRSENINLNPFCQKRLEILREIYGNNKVLSRV